MGVFVDTRSLWLTAKSLQQKIDFQKLLEFIVLNQHLVKSVAYVMTVPGIDQSRFLTTLERIGFQTRCRDLIRLPDGSLHGGWGAGIALDVIHHARKIDLDIVHLVSGDGDFTDLIKFLKTQGIRTEVSGFEIGTDVELKQAADEFVPLGTEIFRDARRFS